MLDGGWRTFDGCKVEHQWRIAVLYELHGVCVLDNVCTLHAQ